jgi:hypothetical protein
MVYSVGFPALELRDSLQVYLDFKFWNVRVQATLEIV